MQVFVLTLGFVLIHFLLNNFSNKPRGYRFTITTPNPIMQHLCYDKSILSTHCQVFLICEQCPISIFSL